jgi:hypothetical protein
MSLRLSSTSNIWNDFIARNPQVPTVRATGEPIEVPR